MKILISKLFKWQILRYFISGGSAFATNIITLFILVHFFHIWYLLSAVISFTISIFVSFTMQKFFTFSNYTKEKIRQQTIFYFGVQIINLGINTFFMYINVHLFNIHYIVSQVITGGIIAIYTFFVYRHLVFYQHIFLEKDIN